VVVGSWRNLLNRFIGLGGGDIAEENEQDDRKGGAPEAYNLYDHDPDFRNAYGWTVAIDKHDYEPLKHSDIGVYLVNLAAV
jgi:secreted PhoX family phosphatase